MRGQPPLWSRSQSSSPPSRGPDIAEQKRASPLGSVQIPDPRIQESNEMVVLFSPLGVTSYAAMVTGTNLKVEKKNQIFSLTFIEGLGWEGGGTAQHTPFPRGLLICDEKHKFKYYLNIC